MRNFGCSESTPESITFERNLCFHFLLSTNAIQDMENHRPVWKVLEVKKSSCSHSHFVPCLVS